MAWKRVRYAMHNGMQTRNIHGGQWPVMLAMVCKFGELVYGYEGSTHLADEQDEEADKLIHDNAMYFSERYGVDIMHVQRGTLWRGCWAIQQK